MKELKLKKASCAEKECFVILKSKMFANEKQREFSVRNSKKNQSFIKHNFLSAKEQYLWNSIFLKAFMWPKKEIKLSKKSSKGQVDLGTKTILSSLLGYFSKAKPKNFEKVCKI